MRAEDLMKAREAEGYSREHMDSFVEWVSLAILGLTNPERRTQRLEILREAIYVLAERAEQLVAEFMAGEPVTLAPEDLPEGLEQEFGEAFTDRFLEITGTMFFIGKHSPSGTAQILVEEALGRAVVAAAMLSDPEAEAAPNGEGKDNAD